MKCPRCKKLIGYVEFIIDPETTPGTGNIKVDRYGNFVDEPSFDPINLTGPDPEPTFYCPKCEKDITESLGNTENFWYY